MSQTLIPIVDVETSGLNSLSNFLLEIAVILTDEDLNEVNRFSQIIHYPQAIVSEIYDMADPFVQTMHTDNGLWDELGKPGPGLEEVDTMLAQWLTDQVEMFRALGHQDESIELRTMGNSLRLDLNFIEEQLPHTYAVLGYRSIDMSAVEKFMTMFAPDYVTYVKQPSTAHRAMADNEMCLEQARSVAQWVALVAAEANDLGHYIRELGLPGPA